MKVSVVTVCYNAVQTLEKTMLSVLNQTYPNVEYIIIDGGSTDGTVDIIKKYADRLAYWVSEPDKGIYDAMNKGTRVATGDFLYFLGADDLFFSCDTLSTITPLMIKECVYYGDSYITNIRKIYWGKFSKYKLAIGNICHQSIFYPKQIYAFKIYDIRFKIFADYVYNIELFMNCPFDYLNETISVFNYNGVSRYCKDEFFNQEINDLILKNLGFMPLVVRIIYKLIRKLI